MQLSSNFHGALGEVDVSAVMAEITISTAGSALQGGSTIEAYRRVCNLVPRSGTGLTPIDFMLPWAPLPHNKQCDTAHARMRVISEDIIKKQRLASDKVPAKLDRNGNSMQRTYRNGQTLPDKAITHIMITLLMAGQHSSSSISSWATLRLASQPAIAEGLYQEQRNNLERTSPNGNFPTLQCKDFDSLPLLQNVIRETFRLHSSMYSLMRKIKNPLQIHDTSYVVPDSHVLLAAPGVTALSDEYFPNAMTWNPRRLETQEPKEDKMEDMVDDEYGNMSKSTSSPHVPFQHNGELGTDEPGQKLNSIMFRHICSVICAAYEINDRH